ncbi:hypothetical protein [Desulfosarcina cetonica]|uniref:hypothetical protein n=1 Tax=Desulfosarcina cetonica TaxID=90730 RepID=UPI0006D08B7E|nr:hypothetical protein [Desulfosarcina cetonica]
MIAARLGGKWLSLLASVLMLAGCGMAAAYRTADKETIRDFSDNGGYLKRVGVMALTNTSMFTSGQAATPFVEAFIASMAENASDAQFIIPGKSDVPSYLINPPRMANGEMDVYALSSGPGGRVQSFDRPRDHGHPCTQI